MRAFLRRVRRSEPRGSWLLAGAALVVLAETDAHALPGGAHLVYSRSRGAERCLDEEGFRDLVASHLGGVDPFTPEGVWRVEVAIARRGRDFRGEVTLFDGGGQHRGQDVYTGPTCAELMEDVGAMVGLLLRPPPRPVAPAPPSPPPAAGVPAAGPLAPALSPPPAPADGSAKPEPARKVPPPAPGAQEPRGTQPAGQAPGAARPRAPLGVPAARSRVQLGVGPLLGFGFLPASSVGITGLAGVRWPATSLVIELRGDLPITVRPTEGVSVETSWVGGLLGACQHASALLACGLATAGRVEWVARYNGRAWASTEPYVGVGVRAGLEVPLSSHLIGQLAGDLLITLNEPRLDLDVRPTKPGPQELWSAPPFAAAVSLRLVASF